MVVHGYNLAPRRLRQEDSELRASMDYTIERERLVVKHLSSTMHKTLGLSPAFWEGKLKQKK